MDPHLDTMGDQTLAIAGTTELTAWIAELGAVDAWRLANDDKKEYTSPHGQSRIDMILLAGCTANNYSAKHIPRIAGSDHGSPTVTTRSSDIEQKHGHWQMPSWLAANAARRIKPSLEKLANATDLPDYVSAFTRAMKDITGKCKATHKAVMRWRKDKEDRAKLRWIRAHMRAAANPTADLINDADNARREWVKEIEEKGRRNRARAFDRHFLEAERCTSFFLSRPRAGRSMVIPGVKAPDGSIKEDPPSIHAEHTRYWKELYSATAEGSETPPTQINIDNLKNVNLPRLSPSDAQTLEQPITDDDIIRSIDRLPKHKAAGADGLRAELFKQTPKLWARVLKPIFNMIRHSSGLMPEPFRESIIILLHKKGCTLQAGNYRPIALTNVISKILSGIHCARLRKVIPSVIPYEQTGFVLNRSITENIILLHDVAHYAKLHHPSSVIVALDFAKAFDRMQHPVMLEIQKKMGLGEKWINTIQTMYNNREARLSINGDLSNAFPLERGVLQGDPLSPMLFILACSPLYAKLREARQAHGIPIPNDNPAPVACFYADDTNLIARSPESAVHLYNVAEWFCVNSGAKLHPGKCIAIPTGPAPPTLSNGVRILSPTECTDILGVPMGPNITRQQQVGKICNKLITKCGSWTHIGRTIEGKITIARAMLLSTIWYVLAAIPTDIDEAGKMQSVINNFIKGQEEIEWNGQTARGNMPNEWFYRAKGDGGWGLTTVLHTLRTRKVTLMRSFMNDKRSHRMKPWHTFVTHMINAHTKGWSRGWSGMCFWKGLYQQEGTGLGKWEEMTPWWRDAWNEWLKLDCQPQRNSITLTQLSQWPVWNNRILTKDHGLDTTLRASFTNSSTRAHMDAIRKAGFIEFKDFINSNGAIMNGTELYTTVTVTMSVNGDEHIVPQQACNSLMRKVRALWENATRRWSRTTPATPHDNNITWMPSTGGRVSFNKANNAAIGRMVRSTTPQPQRAKLIRLQNEPVTTCWKRERNALCVLAPSRRDLMQRLLRNALPLGIKRIHWSHEAQTKCMLCDDNVLETADHIFWKCSFARAVWSNVTTAWRNQSGNDVGWREVLLGYEVRLGLLYGTEVERLWAITRACLIRTLWFERNRRYFYANLPIRTAQFRRNQGLEDIKMHVESWLRRTVDQEQANAIAAVQFLKTSSHLFDKIDTTQPRTAGHIIPHE